MSWCPLPSLPVSPFTACPSRATKLRDGGDSPPCPEYCRKTGKAVAMETTSGAGRSWGLWVSFSGTGHGLCATPSRPTPRAALPSVEWIAADGETGEGGTGRFSPTAYRWSCRSTGGGCFQRAFKCANLNLGSAVRVTIPSNFLGHTQVQGSRPGWDPGMGNGVGGEEEAVMSPAAQEEVVVVLGAALQGLLVSTCCSTRLPRHACRPGRGTGGTELQATGP